MAAKKKINLGELVPDAIDLIDAISSDNSVPRNIRNALHDAKNKLLNESEEASLRISQTIYSLTDISNDINMPSHTRTELWNLISELEFIKEKIK